MAVVDHGQATSPRLLIVSTYGPAHCAAQYPTTRSNASPVRRASPATGNPPPRMGRHHDAASPSTVPARREDIAPSNPKRFGLDSLTPRRSAAAPYHNRGQRAQRVGRLLSLRRRQQHLVRPHGARCQSGSPRTVSTCSRPLDTAPAILSTVWCRFASQTRSCQPIPSEHDEDHHRNRTMASKDSAPRRRHSAIYAQSLARTRLARRPGTADIAHQAR